MLTISSSIEQIARFGLKREFRDTSKKKHIKKLVRNNNFAYSQRFTLKKDYFSKNRKIICVLFLMFQLMIHESSGQEYIIVNLYDTIPIDSGSVIIMNGHELKTYQDTFFILPDTIESARVRPPGYQETKELLDALKERASKKKWLWELHNIIIKPPPENFPDTIPSQHADEPYLMHAGKYIRDIELIALDVFGTSVHDTALKAESWIERTANKLHVKTREIVIRDFLLFHEGEEVDPGKLAENERILRRLSYIQDARIKVIPVGTRGDSVDVKVITKDVWSTAFSVEINDAESGKVEIWNNNMFGMGHESRNSLLWNTKKEPMHGIKGRYNIPNLAGTFIDASLKYENTFDTEQYGLYLDRSFFTPGVKYAGGLSIYNTSTIRRFEYPANFIFYNRVRYSYYNFWAGRSFLLPADYSLYEKRSTFAILGSYYRYRYYKKPFNLEELFYDLYDRSLFLGSLAFYYQSFYQSSLINSFGRVEDIPVGMLINVTAGPEFNQFSNRFYGSLKMSGGGFFFGLGYMHGSAAAGGFLTADGFEQGIAEFNLRYFTNLFILNRYSFRHFINISYTRGINRFNDEYLDLNDRDVIRGFNSNFVRGDSRINVNMETVTFTPFYLYGFRFAVFGFADLGVIGFNKEKVTEHDLYGGFGLGVRVRNELLVFNTFQLRFAIYPVLPPDMRAAEILFTGKERRQFDDFYVDSPEILSFD